ncbi:MULTISPECIES: ABC transporter permease [Actinomadura]|uniref:Putative spermidine/putrescine transport system permease protein n=1 Tax=Actinomadura madurae TaxID=1993 RepID=A0A1I4X0Q9_9ACTN|nr:ABC transporter permease [Actinomadura madurae]SFN19043.1 putative spermidine/putrescine transport system permease protein [Actinomadura madurae]SPT62869.1 Inner membrane ABC transporter permease protein ydcU [Actinomadura madurae]
MTAPARKGGADGRPAPGPRRRAAALLHRRPRLRLSLLLSAPLAWLVVVYLGALAAIFLTAFWSTDVFTGEVVRRFTLANFQTLLDEPVYRTVALRSLGVAVAVTAIDAVIGFPMALYMAKVARPRHRPYLMIAILAPLWAAYLVKAYAWRVMLSQGGIVDEVLGPLGLSSPGYGLPATVLVLSYLWLPYMILPVYTGLERLPDSLLDASGDLGARPLRTFRSVILPLVFPSLVAGSIFTFSLSLGDYITVKIVGGRSQLLGNVVYDNIGAANNLPFAAAVATIPVVVMLGYLAAARRTGALREL